MADPSTERAAAHVPAADDEDSEEHGDDSSQGSDHGRVNLSEAGPAGPIFTPPTRAMKRKQDFPSPEPRRARKRGKRGKLPANATDLDILDLAAEDMATIQATRTREKPDAIKLLSKGANNLKEAYRAFLRVAETRRGFDLPRPWTRKHPRSQEYLTALLQFSRTIYQYVQDRDRNIAQGWRLFPMADIDIIPMCGGLV